MDSKEFLTQNLQVIDYINTYLTTLKDKDILPNVSPGYLSKLLPKEMPTQGESFNTILKDFDEQIMKGVVHWAHPHFHAYLPSSHAYPSILADMFSSACGALGFSWIAGPSVVELEVAMTDWLGVSLGLPAAFLNRASNCCGGGVMTSSATECITLTMIAARVQAINFLKRKNKKIQQEDSEYVKELVAYCSDECHSCVKKAATVAMVTLRVLETNANCQLAPETLLKALEKDLRQGLFPCYVVVTLGTSSSGAFDNLDEIALVVKNVSHCWIHVNAAYGGNNFICPELRRPLTGIHCADSICVNPYKGLLINIDSTCLWVRDRVKYCSALTLDPAYLNPNEIVQHLDQRHWSLWLSRRFRALKIWFTFRLYGVIGLQKHVRHMIKMAQKFADLVNEDERFELCNKVITPLVCFRMIGSDGINQELLASINSNNKILMTPALLRTKYVLRFVVGHESTDEKSIKFAWASVFKAANNIYSDVIWDERTENKFRRLSFTRRVSFIDYRIASRKKSLKDDHTPILVPTLEEDMP